MSERKNMSIVKRIYTQVAEEHFSENVQMFFLAGPRQAGKTTVGLIVQQRAKRHVYFNWDNSDHRQLILAGPGHLAEKAGLHALQEDRILIVFDEIHKYRKWKSFLKGFYDTYKERVHIIVTGSSKLDVYKRGGDSLMGRYFLYRLYPLTIAELLRTAVSDSEISAPKRIKDDEYESLMRFGGFPEPYIKSTTRFLNKWHALRKQQLIYEDIRDLSRVQELGQMELLADMFIQHAGGVVNYSNCAKKVRVSNDTIRRWVKTFSLFYFCFTLQPWSRNVPRSLLKEPKVYLWDWSLVEEGGKRYENCVAVHLMKAIHFWQDRGLGKYGLYFLRDKEKREVDFVVTKNNKPWFMVEVKASQNDGLSKHLLYYRKKLDVSHAFQVVFDMEYVNKDCFSEKGPIVVPAKTFLSQLV